MSCENRELADCTQGCRTFSGCLGESFTCASLSDRPMLCVQTADCRYVGSCEGREGCENVDYETCGETPGCVQVARCFGGSITCASLEESQCELHPECRLGEQCQGKPDSCGDLSSTAECSSVPGCFPADTEPAVVN